MDWIKRFIRRHTRPIPRYRARYFHDRLTVVYFMLGWTAAGIALFEILTYDPDSLPDHLNVHADPDEKYQPSVYKAAQRIQQRDEDMELKVVTIKNFTLQSFKPLKVTNLEQKVNETREREKEDFFGSTEGSQNEEQNVTM